MIGEFSNTICRDPASNYDDYRHIRRAPLQSEENKGKGNRKDEESVFEE